MAEEIIKNVTKKTWYKWSIYVNIILFFIVALFLYLLVLDFMRFKIDGGELWLYVTRDIAFICIALAIIFVQFFRNLFVIIKRSL